SNDVLAAAGFEPNKWPELAELRKIVKSSGYDVSVRPAILTPPSDEPRVIGTREAVLGSSRTTRGSRAAAVVTGTVKELYPSDLSEVLVETPYGDIDVVLAPKIYLDDRRLTFEDNANVRIKGYTSIDGDRSVLVATEVMTRPGRWVRLRNEDLTPLWYTAFRP